MVHCIPIVIGYKVEYKFLIEKNLCINFSPRPECLQVFNFLVMPYLKGFVLCRAVPCCDALSLPGFLVQLKLSNLILHHKALSVSQKGQGDQFCFVLKERLVLFCGPKILLTFIFLGVSFHLQVYVFGFSAPAEILYTQFLSETLY